MNKIAEEIIGFFIAVAIIPNAKIDKNNSAIFIFCSPPFL